MPMSRVLTGPSGQNTSQTQTKATRTEEALAASSYCQNGEEWYVCIINEGWEILIFQGAVTLN